MSWRQEQANDAFFRRAKAEGYRARSAYKLLEICSKHKLIKPGQAVLDLGAAPGSWSQVASERVGPSGKVVAIDLQLMAALPGVESFVGDIRDAMFLTIARNALGRSADVVLSDIAPPASGVGVVDQARSIELAEHAFTIATEVLRSGGAFVVKVFRGEDFDRFIATARQKFYKVNVVIPEATRAESRESFVVARGFGFPAP
ncbi:MAG TPA: RlmE family RNA methyltransferase, partial [Chloroflexota bacterium]|nr:RlmE family RNA methyltransferase [Chloroflexota bacterium]